VIIFVRKLSINDVKTYSIELTRIQNGNGNQYSVCLMIAGRMRLWTWSLGHGRVSDSAAVSAVGLGSKC